MKKVCLVTCFFGRHEKVERILRCFLNQTYRGPLTLLLYNNCKIPQILDRINLPSNKNIILVNNHKDLITKEEYTNVGDIFRDALTFVPDDTEIISWFDSDDLFLPSHVSEGVKGWIEAKNIGKVAYKPYYSYYLHGDNKSELAHNTMEPSFFIQLEWVKQYGFHPVAASYHQKWEQPLKDQQMVLVSKGGNPTFLYDWGKGHGTHKISGLGDDKGNFEAHRRAETDNGDGILTPSPEKIVQKYYNLVK